ncbi:conserved hypothetical protein [Histoplasma mississippiense (nom. inval.)]|uniref:conserved hypothetical protein n=1 Tax=Ajellomyces capsulatus (strain NAm1 / WU24) TaxID=2059318 RepID=UPI000157CE22|nr:conserved hypothetical protein [Histoplasma mississippiense (nom. inval.)]EDN10194.1 conserved hypothetical protein [Histoplasma mississippiense (nom. inval.)]
MSVADSVMGLVNGHRGNQPDLKEMIEYEKIVNLHDQIFSGNHPRLKVPQHVVRKVTTRSVQTPPLPIVHSIPAEPLEAPQIKTHPIPSSMQPNTLALANGSTAAAAAPAGAAPAASQAAATSSHSGPSGHLATQKPASEIDPIFLTKSDDLIRAELQLQRQRVERTLRDRIEQRKIEYRLKTCLQEAKPDFDVSEVLREALLLVKPTSTTDLDGANADTAANDSLEDNSFYSSKAPDSPQIGDRTQQLSTAARQDPVRPAEDNEIPYEGHVVRQRVEGRNSDSGDRDMMDVEMQEPLYNVADKNGPSRSPENLTPRRPSPSRYHGREQPDISRVANEGRVADSSDQPYIKPEPVSPLALSDLPLASSSKQRPHHEGPVYVDISSPRYSPVDNRRESGQRRVYEEHTDRGYDMGHPIDLSIPRSTSRIAYTKPSRDDQNLRRVASLHNVRQPEYVHDYIEPPTDYQPRLIRATSYAVTDRPAPQERVRYYEEPAQPYGRRYISGDVSPPRPSRLRESYPEIEPEPRVMAPPQRRVVVDADGNRYIEQIATPAPRLQPLSTPSGRFARMESYNEGPSHMATGGIRASSVMEDPYHDRGYSQNMPPPPLTYRRAPAPEYPREVVRERPIYAREVDERGLADYAPPLRHATYFEDPLPREDMVRMSSVRPPPSRYGEPSRQPLQRMQSNRPGGREVSVYVDDEPRPRREYAPVERAGFATARPVREEQYYDD